MEIPYTKSVWALMQQHILQLQLVYARECKSLCCAKYNTFSCCNLYLGVSANMAAKFKAAICISANRNTSSMHGRKQNHVVEIRSDKNEAKNNGIIYTMQAL